MDPTRDTTSDRTSSTNDSTGNVTTPRSRTRAYDAEGSALKYWIDRLQGLCAGRTDIEAIREATKILGRATQLFFESRQRYLDSLPEEERDPAIMEFDKLIDKLKTTQRQTNELLATAKTPSSAEITQPPATKNNDPKTNSTRPIPKLPTFDGDILQFKAFWDQFNAAVHRREDLEDVTKFVHLRSCLAGAALHAISGVTTAAENYPAVVQLLYDRFYRVSDVLDAHILKIFSVTKEVAKGKEGLLALHDKLNGHLLELRAIGRDLDTTVSGFRTALPQLVAQLPKNIQSRWKDQCGKLTEEPTSQTFLNFLAEQARCAVDLVQSTQGERISSPTHKHTLKENQRKRSRPSRQTIGAFHTSLHPTCPVCQDEHRVTVCPQFLNQQWSERRATAARLNMCFICLTKGHRADRCKFKHRGWRTHHLLTSPATKKQTPLPEGLDDTHAPPGKKARPESSEETTTRVLHGNTRGSARIRFQTVKAIATGANGKRLVINCLFDSGAEQTLVTEDTARALGLVGMAESVTVKGIGGIHCTPTLARRVRFRLSPVKANNHDLDVEPIEALTLPRICDDIQSVPVRCDNWKHLQHLRIPEEQDEKLPVHVLIGVDSYGRFLGEKILRGNPTEPVAIETTLGWVVFALWWHGPPWLMQDRENWPTEPVARMDDNEHLTTEQKTVKVLASQIDGFGVEQVINPTRYSRYETLIRVTAYCLRFARNCQNPVSERTNSVNLSVKKLSDAEVRWLRQVQVNEFGIKSDSADRVREFEPFLDQDGLLRMGGRLRRSTLPPESKHPIILPNNHPVTELLIKDHHVRQMHAGVNQTLVAIRTKFWIIRSLFCAKSKHASTIGCWCSWVMTLRFYSLWDIWVKNYLRCIILPKMLQLMSDCILSKADVNSDSTCQRNRQRRLHKRRLFLEELGKALLQPEMMWRKTLPRTAAAKSAVERMRKDAEQPSTSGIIDTDTGGKKRARCQLCVSSDNKTSVRCKKCQKYICKDHTQSYCNLCAEEI
ncbi:conserved hypothetical protein [Trichinella spiralis]|uniref:hypothetical protein n=2 Tax=Trichinella spiralis TaxID=6334 RepID=UPI0001EFD1DE|nr:conserved hypothetical protein [Trichinella spiralis]